MGYLLYREVRDRAPSDWTPTERLVAWVIADDANDKTRKSWIRLPEIMQRTGIATESGVRQALQRLAGRGYEFRVPISTGRDGRKVFAAKGHSLDFLVPEMPERQLPEAAFEPAGKGSPNPSGNPREDVASTSRDPYGNPAKYAPEPSKATVTDVKGDCAQSPLSSEPPLKSQKMAPRRARALRDAGDTDTQAIFSDVKEAVAAAFGDKAAALLSDADCAKLYDRFCCHPDGTPREIKTSVRLYLLRGPFGDIPDLETALKPKRTRLKIPFDAQIRYDNFRTTDEERIKIVEDIAGTFGPGEEPAVERMIGQGRPLGYILDALSSENLFTAA